MNQSVSSIKKSLNKSESSGTESIRGTLNKWISFMPFGKLRRAFDKLTTNEINRLPFVLSLSKDLIRASLGNRLLRVALRQI
ncbi:hypothetical protein [Methylocaldum sp.]|uniref:hypothetical protein n=1 Tax=Methylocaldum sp. TaxID=1969727 RepID=UPI002D309B5C|nr:hypothetical protein [Methylocaldum sp.]HYE36312.1 hypothetical protein [Methylocaldum sp.]